MVEKVTVFSKPDSQCRPCWATKRRLDEKGVPYTPRDVTVDREAEAEAKTYGFMQTPIVVVDFSDGSQETWSGFDPDRIDVLAQRFAA